MNTLSLQLEKIFSTRVTPTRRVCEVAAMFGLGVDGAESFRAVPPFTLRMGTGRVVFVTGASGGGKSTVLNCVREELSRREDVRVIEFEPRFEGPGIASPGLCERPIVEGIGGSLDDAARWLSLAGLSEARAMLRKPCELSEGQRWRWKLARAMGEVEKLRAGLCESGIVRGAQRPEDDEGEPRFARGVEPLAKPRAHSARLGNTVLPVVIADEFCSTLDRLTAAVVARSVRKWVTRSGVCLVAASAHDDLIEHLEPEVLVVKGLGEEIEVYERGD